jgi:hypothetical protein
MIILIITLAFFSVLTAPPYTALYIITPPEINIYEPLIKAVTYVESCNGKYTYNAKEGAVGEFQIRLCRLQDYNKEMGTNYVLDDMYDYELSRKVFLHYTRGRTYEIVARAWCSGERGTKKASESYWRKILANL